MRRAFIAAVFLSVCVSNAFGQQAAPKTDRDPAPRLSELGALESQWKAVHNDLMHVAAFPVPDDKRRELLLRCARLDELSTLQLNEWNGKVNLLDRQLADAAQRAEVASIRRQISLTWLSRIESAVLQSELFAANTPDAAATGASAAQLAETGLLQLPAQSIVRDEVLRLLAEAHLQSGNADAATASLQSLLQSDPENASERVSSLMVRILIARRDLRAADDRLRSFFGDDPLNAPKSSAMDLARLQYLMAAAQEDRPDVTPADVADWVDAIGQRSGPSVLARAETMVARATGLNKTSDHRLQIADGLFQLRTGHLIPAAVTLAKSAVADPNAQRSIRTATQSAAILASQDKLAAAAELLVQIASRHADQADAANLALQAAGMLADPKISNPDVEKTHAILEQILHTWSTHPAARVARDWLIERSIAMQEWTAAAELAMGLPSDHWNESAFQRCEVLWQMAAGVPVSKLGWNDFGEGYPTIQCRNRAAWNPQNLSQQLDQTAGQAAVADFQKIAERLQVILVDSSFSVPPQMQQRLAATLLDNQSGQLADWLSEPTQDTDAEIVEYVSLRQNPLAVEKGPSILRGRLEAFTWRLDRDAQLQPALRPSIAKNLLRIHESQSDSPLATWRWRIWAGQTEETVQRWRALAASDPNRGLIAGILAQALSQSESSPVQSMAWKMWRELADGLPRNATAWSLVSVQAIESQYRSGDREGAIQAASYLLLTTPPSDASLRTKLKRIASP